MSGEMAFVKMSQKKKKKNQHLEDTLNKECLGNHSNEKQQRVANQGIHRFTKEGPHIRVHPLQDSQRKVYPRLSPAC